MIYKPKTDRESSASADEFVWDTSEHTEVHEHVGQPVLRLLAEQQANTVMDLGCGNGAFTAFLAEHNYSMTGLDHSHTGIELSQKHHPQIHFAQHDVLQPLPQQFIGKYDAVVSVEVIEHLLLPRKLVENAMLALKPRGLFILTTPYHGYWKNLALALSNKFDSHWHPLRDYGHIKFFSKRTILELFSEFRIEHVRYDTVGRIPVFARSMIVSGQKSY